MTFGPISPVTGLPMARGVRDITLTYKGHSVVVEMPGWYEPGSREGVHTAEDMKVSDKALKMLKASVEEARNREEHAA